MALVDHKIDGDSSEALTASRLGYYSWFVWKAPEIGEGVPMR